MLKFFNRLEKTRNFVLLIFAILMVGSLVFFYTPARNTFTTNLSTSDETAAKVSGEKITAGEVVRQKEQYSQFGGGRSFPSKMILDGLINSRISRLEADRLGLTASDAEVADQIRQQLKKPDGTTVDQATYQQNAIDQAGSVAAYEQAIRDDISSRKLDAFITSGVTVSEQDVLDDFQKKNTKFDLNYVAISSTDLGKKIVPTDQELLDYFNANKASYYISVPQKKVKYVFVNTDKIGQKLQITDADLQAEWNNVPAERRTAGVLGQEIVLRVPKPEEDATVQGRATDIIQELRKNGPTVSEDDFAKVAKGRSENPQSAGNGGKLSGPVRENTNKPDDPYQRLLKMKPGEITEPISYQSRYFILRRGDDVPKTFEMAKKELEVSLRNRKAYSVAAELAQKIADSLKETKDPVKTAQQFAAQANMTAAEMVKETGYLKPGDDVAGIGISPQFESGIEPLASVGDVGDKTPVPSGFAIPMLVDRKEPRDAEFDEVKAQIVDVVKVEKARAQVEQIAKDVAAAATNAGALGGAATAKGFEAKDQKNFVLGSPVGEGPTAGTNEELETAIYAMKAGEVSKIPFKVGDNWYVVGVTSRTDANTADFAKQRSGLLEQMLSTKRAGVFNDYLSAIRQRYEKDGSIKVYKEVLTKIDGEDKDAIPGEDEDNS
ncbi:MAG TPA: peptidyl-prolyl cis-trans isomerase [Pyrinomonadaceae bacterium]|jgi:peptidyl-prolyl cis-trans isomerase D|nr:peptidyl-prolyl cis-trans isomerase [Pyrinomonadaceae bacterium]